MPKWNSEGKAGKIGPASPWKIRHTRATSDQGTDDHGQQDRQARDAGTAHLTQQQHGGQGQRGQADIGHAAEVGGLAVATIAQRAATGIRVRPMMVMTIPLTSGGKNLVMRENTRVINSPISEAAITAPANTAGRPPPPLPRIATMVATPARTPWTSGNCEPKKAGRGFAARLPGRRQTAETAISRPISAGDNRGLTDDQRHCNDTAIHGQHMLQP